jgi:hypothetical protein
MSPGTVGHWTTLLRRIIARWPHLSDADKDRLARGKPVVDDQEWRET